MTTRMTLADDAADEAFDSEPGEQHEEEPEHGYDAACVHMRQGRSECGAQAFAHVNDGVDQDSMLEDWHLIQVRPRIVDAAEEGDGHDHRAEDEADLGRLDA